MNRPTIEQLEALPEGARVRHAIFGECSVEAQDTCSAPGGMDLRIFSEGKEVEFATMAQVEPLTIKAEPTESDDVWTHPFSLTASGTLTADAETEKEMRRLMESMRISRKERRRMFHAVTHGGAVVIPSYIKVEHENGETEEFPRTVYITRPAVQEPMILDGADAGCNDFYFIEPGFMTPAEAESSTEDTDILMDMEANLGKEYPFEAFSSRDGFFEGDEVGFAIYSRQEVEEMIRLLQEALEKGYRNF